LGFPAAGDQRIELVASPVESLGSQLKGVAEAVRHPLDVWEHAQAFLGWAATLDWCAAGRLPYFARIDFALGCLRNTRFDFVRAQGWV